MGEESGMLREEPGQSDKGKGAPRLVDQLREAIRRRYYSRRTEEAYVHGFGASSTFPEDVIRASSATPRSRRF
jgi:hypothetical protein